MVHSVASFAPVNVRDKPSEDPLGWRQVGLQTVALAPSQGKSPVLGPIFGSAAETTALKKFIAIPNPTQQDWQALRKNISERRFLQFLETQINVRLSVFSPENKKLFSTFLLSGYKRAFLEAVATQLSGSALLASRGTNGAQKYKYWKDITDKASENYYKARAQSQSQPSSQGAARLAQNAYRQAVGIWAGATAALLVDPELAKNIQAASYPKQAGGARAQPQNTTRPQSIDTVLAPFRALRGNSVLRITDQQIRDVVALVNKNGPAVSKAIQDLPPEQLQHLVVAVAGIQKPSVPGAIPYEDQSIFYSTIAHALTSDRTFIHTRSLQLADLFYSLTRVGTTYTPNIAPAKLFAESLRDKDFYIDQYAQRLLERFPVTPGKSSLTKVIDHSENAEIINRYGGRGLNFSYRDFLEIGLQAATKKLDTSQLSITSLVGEEGARRFFLSLSGARVRNGEEFYVGEQTPIPPFGTGIAASAAATFAPPVARGLSALELKKIQNSAKLLLENDKLYADTLKQAKSKFGQNLEDLSRSLSGTQGEVSTKLSQLQRTRDQLNLALTKVLGDEKVDLEETQSLARQLVQHTRELVNLLNKNISGRSSAAIKRLTSLLKDASTIEKSFGLWVQNGVRARDVSIRLALWANNSDLLKEWGASTVEKIWHSLTSVSLLGRNTIGRVALPFVKGFSAFPGAAKNIARIGKASGAVLDIVYVSFEILRPKSVFFDAGLLEQLPRSLSLDDAKALQEVREQLSARVYRYNAFDPDTLNTLLQKIDDVIERSH